MARKKQLNTHNNSPNKYRQLRITSFLVCKHNGPTIINKIKSENIVPCFKPRISSNFNTQNLDKSLKMETTMEDITLPFSIPHYVAPVVEENAIVLPSDDEDHEDFTATPKKCRKIEEDSSLTCHTNLGEHPLTTSTNSNNLPPARFLLKNSSVIESKSVSIIGVFPQSKLKLVKNTIPRILLEKSESIPSLLSPFKFVTGNEGSLTQKNLDKNNQALNQNASLQTEIPHPDKMSRAASEVSSVNWSYLDNFKHIYSFVSSHPQFSKLFMFAELQLMDLLLKVDEQYSYFCIRLFIRKQKWNNIFKLKTELGMDISDLEVRAMYDSLVENEFLTSDYSCEDPVELLDLLTVSDIKDLCKYFKLKVGREKKCLMIKHLLDNCSNQSLLVPSNTMTVILIKRIKEKMGICVMLTTPFYNLLKKIHLLYSFTTREFKSYSDMYFFLNRIHSRDIILPSYSINKNTRVFSSQEELLWYTESLECRKCIEEAYEKKQKSIMLEFCKLASQQLTKIDNSFQTTKPPYLFCFTSIYGYTKALSFGLQFLTKLYPQQVEGFLTLLLSKTDHFHNMRGFWYDLLIMIRYNYYKKHELAAETLIEALNDKHLTEIQQCQLNHRAEYIRNHKTNKIPKLLRDRICFAQAGDILPSIEIDAKTIHREQSIGKKLYVKNVNGDIIIETVEEVALSHYFATGYTNGFHCENSLIWTLFFTLLWDAIYDDSIPSVFLLEIQSLPLDFYTQDFYKNRKQYIDNILEDILQWSDEKLLLQITKNWKHSNKRSLIASNLDLDPENIFHIILCIGRNKLVNIFIRLLSDMKGFRSGLPDLFLWNPKTKLCKFVEVKNERDKLSCSQEVWLKFLKSINCDVEVCHVHSIGSKARAAYKKRQ